MAKFKKGDFITCHERFDMLIRNVKNTHYVVHRYSKFGQRVDHYMLETQRPIKQIDSMYKLSLKSILNSL